jgi:hypothetical protein
MSRSIHALLVAIDDYPDNIPKLRGCVNDIDAFAAYLSERVAKEKGVALELRMLKNGEATRQAVIDAFRNHLGKAKKGDVALFYYSGHGSQEQAPEEFWTLEPDHLDETLVLFDSRKEGSWDLADKEIAKLIAEVAGNEPHFAVILDCCHSGSGTRDVETTVRRAPTDLRRRPIGSFIATLSEAEAAATRSVASQGASRFAAPKARHVLFAACRDDQEANEYVGDGTHRGAFSFFLCDTLKRTAGVPTYRDLFTRASSLVSNMRLDQSPQLETTHNEDLDAVFLDGAIQPAPATFAVSYQDRHWRIKGGAASGIPAPAGADVARAALYPFDAPAADLGDVSKAVAMADVVEVLPASSRLALDENATLDPQTTYKAMIVSVPTPAVCVRLEGDAACLSLVRKALETASPEGKPSLFVREASASETPEFRLLAANNRFVITRSDGGRPLVDEIVGLKPEKAKQAVARLEHMARWTQTARLDNPASSIKPNDVTMTVLVDGKEAPGRELRLEYKMKDGKEVEPSIKVSLTNNSKRSLYCGLLDLTQRFAVLANLMEEACVKLKPGETFWANDGEPIPASVPDEVWEQGIIEYKDLLKLIICTEEFDAKLLEQPSLDVPRSAEQTKGISQGESRGFSRGGTLNQLMMQLQTREVGRKKPAVIDDWQATEFAFTTVRPLPSTPVPGKGKPAAEVRDGVRLHGHSKLKAKATLSSAPLATRDLATVTLPALLYDDPSVCQPLTFTTARGSDPGLSVLELTDVNDAAAVTPQEPLLVTVPVGLASNEHVLPVAYDGEFFLPLGRVESKSPNETVIALDRLPPPLVDSRSLTGAIKIFFQKVISKVVGLDFPYPILAAADVAADGSMKAVRDAVGVRNRVARAKRILLFIHGIIGDTQSMAPSVQLAKLADARPLESLYDLVLTFDYENLNTKIEENGRLLKAKLEDAGLGPGHGKTLEIAAHSMGGLVSRWFIEREGGNQIVQRLVMLGTPNGGSPWPKIVDWALVALTLGLNHLTAIPWSASVIGWLTAWLENPTVALNEMLSTAPVLAELNKSPDPGIPYVIIAGNTSLIPAAVVPAGPDKRSPLVRLLARLTSPDILHKVANPFFLDQENDVAVSVMSMEKIAPGRKKLLDVRPAACDHMSYFRDPEGLKALAGVLESAI